MKIEVGPGDKPEAGYDVYCDLHQTPFVTHLCHMEALPFPAGCATDLRAYEVLEHQSYQLVLPTLLEWYRVLARGGRLHVKVPNARFYIEAYFRGDYPIERLNLLIMGGHADKPVFEGYDAQKDVPRWLWNAHHTLFDARSLRAALEGAGFQVESLEGQTHLVAEGVKP